MEIKHNLNDKELYDYKIVCHAIAGDEKAYGELFKRYKDSVYFMLLKMINNRTDAEDLMFEAFEKAFTSLNYYSPEYPFSTWLFKIASKTGIDFIRKKKNLLLDFETKITEGNNKIELSSENEEIIRQQRADFIREKVTLLKGRYRKLIELRYFDEFSYEEIANTLAIPLSTVKTQLFRARELLLNILLHTDIENKENELFSED